MPDPILPLWFKQRQARLEPAGENSYKVVAPQAPEASIGIRPAENGRWSAFLRTTADGADSQATAPEFENPGAAWEAAFEFYRQQIIY
jgi:hypothetical protein